MEYCSNGRKRRGGFMKAGKQLIIPFYRSTPKSAQYCSSTNSVGCSSSKVVLKPNISTAADSHTTASTSSLPAHKLVSFVNVPQTSDPLHHPAGDLQVDAKAATYISAVQERFKMERINSERMKTLQLPDSPHSDHH